MIRSTFPTLCVGLLVSSCFLFGGGEDRQPVPHAWQETKVYVSNENWLDMHVYLVDGTSQFSLGTVTSQNTEAFDLPRWTMDRSNIRFLADPIGSGRGYVSDAIVVYPGQDLQFTVANNLRLSRLYPR